MPVIVVGADTRVGEALMDALLPRPSEVRAFVTSPNSAATLRARGVKVALGDVSDGSHVGGAALNAYCAVLIAAAATDDRERSFAANATDVVGGWVEGLTDARVSRVIYVGDDDPSELKSLRADFVRVRVADRPLREVAAEVAAFEDAATLNEA